MTEEHSMKPTHKRTHRRRGVKRAKQPENFKFQQVRGRPFHRSDLKYIACVGIV